MLIKTKITIEDGYTVVLDLDGDSHIVKNFQLKELANLQSNDEIKMILNGRTMKFLTMIQEFRTWFNKPMNINSCYRTPSFNASIKGADPRSLHLKALAIDWGIIHNETQRTNVRNKWADICLSHHEIGGINFYTHGYHLDIGEEQFGYKTFQFRDYRKKAGDW